MSASSTSGMQLIGRLDSPLQTDTDRYDLPHRIHSSQIYPLPAPNGSTVIVYGHDRGVRILWRGGRRQRDAPKAPQANGASRSQDIITIDDSEEESQQEPSAQFEDEEDELDPDCPYPSIIQDVEVGLGVEVLHVAVPSSLPSLTVMPGLKRRGAVAFTCSDGSIRTLAFNLQPPSYAETPDYQRDIQTLLSDSGKPCTGLAAKVVMSDVVHPETEQVVPLLLVTAGVSDGLHISHAAILAGDIYYQGIWTQLVALPHRARDVSFHPSASSTQILLSDVSGAVRMYEAYARTNTDSGTVVDQSSSPLPSDQWLFTFMAPYTTTDGSLARRKQVLAASFILSGRAILALLEDGEWGIWSLSGDASQGGNISDFVLRGSLSSPAAGDPSTSARQPKSRLAPMTPNTRKAKSETFFSGPTAKSSGAAARGGISVVTSSVRAGQTDESVVLWYGSDIYSIPSLQTFWQRSTNRNTTGGGLYAPGLTHISDINLMNEAITSISQFAPSTATSGVGTMNTQRDLLVSAEHRLIILQALRPPTAARILFPQAPVERPVSQDQTMLDAGALDVGGMDRLLDGMANGDARPRRVGFAR